MTAPSDWAEAYIQQARVDLAAAESLEGQHLSVLGMLLQMTFEKTAKAALLYGGRVSVEDTRKTHRSAASPTSSYLLTCSATTQTRSSRPRRDVAPHPENLHKLLVSNTKSFEPNLSLRSQRRVHAVNAQALLESSEPTPSGESMPLRHIHDSWT